MKLFVSYRSTDSAQVDAIVARLRSLGYEVWQDKDSIPVGEDWWKAICTGIQDCDVFLFMLSAGSVKSLACQAELSFAYQLNLPIIPFVLGGEWVYNASGKHDIRFWDDVPSEITDNRAQFLFYEGVAFVEKLKDGIAALLAKNLPRLHATPPPDPRHATDTSNNATVIYDEACDFAHRGELRTAEKLFRKLFERQDPDYGNFSHQWILLIRRYRDIKVKAEGKNTRKIAYPQWQAYVQAFPNEFLDTLFDPYKLAELFASPESRVTPPPQQHPYSPPPQMQRHGTASDFAYLKSHFPQSTQHRFSPYRAGVAVLVLVVIVGIIGVLFLNGRDDEKNSPRTPLDLSVDQIAFTPVTRNADWTPFEHNFEGVTMVLVPAGCFSMGSNDGDDDEQPIHEQCFEEPFWIDKYEVTQAQFVSFGGQKASANEFTGDNLPVEMITWYEAKAFCELRGGRLPTEAEWEYAARGPDALVYPWGNEFIGDNVVYGENSNGQTANVGSRPSGVSWVGALDISGNVWEWTSSLDRDYPYDAADGRENSNDVSDNNYRVMRGGSWNVVTDDLRAPYRNRDAPYFRVIIFGMRCASSFIAEAELQATQMALTPSPTQTIPPPNTAISSLNVDQSAFTPVTHNVDWTPVEQDFEGVTMVLVPAGCFSMGSSDGDDDEQPIHEQCFEEPFWIDKYEVTQAQFVSFGGQKASANEFTGDNLPVESITWYEAKAFCELRGARLPTEAEWEYTARGPDALVYTWGNEFAGDNVVYGENSNWQTANVGSRPSGVSWVGALDMSGNVGEWTNSLDQAYPYDAADGRENSNDISNNDSRILRGGTFSSNSLSLHASFRNRDEPYNRYYLFGMRCASSFIAEAELQATQMALTPSPTQTIPPPNTAISSLNVEQSAFTPVTHNVDWTPVEQDFDGVTMVLVPAGCFSMGSSDGEDDEQPIHEQCFEEPFWIDKYEVTQAQFASFGGQKANANRFIGDNRPVETITWHEAKAFCELRGARLPTEAEWEYTARGPNALVYPWGNEFIANNVVYGGNSNNQTANVGSRPSGVSWVGALDMSGNVWEWTSSLHRDYPYDAADGRENSNDVSDNNYRVMRGGSRGNYTGNVRAPIRFGGAPNDRYDSFGLRCASSY